MPILSGRSGDHESLALTLVVHTLLLIGLLYAGYRSASALSIFQNRTSAIYLGAVLVKLVLTLASYYIHTRYYTTGDLATYWHDAEAIAFLTDEGADTYTRYLFYEECTSECPPLTLMHQPRALLFAKGLSVLHLLTGGSAWLTSLWLSAMCLAATWYFFVRVARIWPWYSVPAALALLFYPSPVFWSSGIQKETIALTCIYLAASFMLPMLAENLIRRWWLNLLLTLLLLYLLWLVKYYYAAVFGPILLLAAFISVFSGRWDFIRGRAGRQVLLAGILLVAGFMAGRNLHIAFSRQHFLPLITRTHHEVAARSDEGAANHMPGLVAEPASFLAHVPEAVLTGYFRPLPGDGSGPVAWPAIAENTFLLILAIWALVTFFRQRSISFNLTAATILAYCSVLAVFLAFAMPNYGTLMRYKAVFLPFFLLLILSVLWTRPMKLKRTGKK